MAHNISFGEGFPPETIGIVGVSKTERMIVPGYTGLRIFLMIKDSGFRGRIYPINPKFEEIDGMTRLVPIKNTLFGNDHSKAIGATFHHTRAYAPACALATGNDGVDTELIEMRHQWRTPEGTGRKFS